MVTLTLLHPQSSQPLQQWDFDRQSIVKIGRSPDNDIILNDPLVSRYHLQLIGADNEGNSLGGITPVKWQVINQGTNGTFINGVLVTQAWIAPNSIIQLAQNGPKLKFEIQQSSPLPPTVASVSSRCTHAGNPAGNLFCTHCGQPIQILRYIHQYQVLKILGQGGMGTTYLAWDAQGKISGKPQLLVLKEMNANMVQIPKARELFFREASILQGLQHPGIPSYYDFFEEDGKHYLAMELVHGQDLEKRINQFGPVTPQQAIEWIIQVCEVLEYIHSQNPKLIHRDIKPANLMVRPIDNRIVVLDFGAVKVGASLLPGTRIGAEGYTAPEQERGQPCTQSDLFALGPTLIFLLTGENPMNFYRSIQGKYGFDVSQIPTIAPPLQAIIAKVTEVKPRDRYQTAQEVSQALAKLRE